MRDMMYLPINLRRRANHRRQIRGNPSLDKLPIHGAQSLIIPLLGILRHGKIKPVRAIQLRLDEPGTKNPSPQIDHFIGTDLESVKHFLVLDYLARYCVDAQVLLDELVIPNDSAIRESDDSIRCRWRGLPRHDGDADIYSIPVQLEKS